MAFKHDLKRCVRSYTKQFYFADVAAKAVTVHAAVDDDAVNLFPGPFTNPAVPRSLQILFAASWAGGDVTIAGTDQFGAPITEVIADTAGATVVGVKIFKTVTSASKEIKLTGGHTCTLQTGPKIGIMASVASARGALFVAGASEAVVLDTTYDAFTPTSTPNGALDFLLLAQIDHDYVPLV